MKAEIKACLIAGLEAGLDRYMSENDFNRRRSSLIYSRNFRSSTQRIELTIQIHPKDNPGASAAIYPQMEVLMPSVDRVLDAMIGDDVGLLEGITGGTSKQPIGFTTQKAHTGRWFIYQPSSVPTVVDEISAFLQHWTMPLLNVYATPEDVLLADQGGDKRLLGDRAQLMRVVAASLVYNRKDYAQELMEKSLGSVGARRRYERVFDYVQKSSEMPQPLEQ